MERRAWFDWPAPGEVTASAVTMGVFDGFHRGHVALADAAVAAAHRRGIRSMLVTFDPHPLTVLAPERAPLQLLSVDDRVAQAFSHGVDDVVVLPFTAELAETPADHFVAHGLVDSLGVRELVVGSNFRCGRGAEGDIDFLRTAGRRHGFDVQALDLVREGRRTCSSTEVRRCLARGDVRTARELLGRDDPRILELAGR